MPERDSPASYGFGEFVLDIPDQRLSGPHGFVKIGNKAFGVLQTLVRAGGRLVGKEELFETVWNGTIVTESALTSVIKELRRALGDDPHEPVYIESVYGRGYRLIAPVTRAAAPIVVPVAATLALRKPEITPQATGIARDGASQRSRLRKLAWAGLIVLLLAASAAVLLSGRGGAGKRIVVEPLHIEARDEAAKVLRQSLSNDLSRMVLGNDTAISFVEGANAAEAGTPADFTVSGEAQSSGGTLQAVTRLINARDGSILWSREFTGPADNVAGLRQQMAGRIAEVLVCAFGARSRRPADIDLATLRLFLAGCENFHSDWPVARKFLGEVVKKQPKFAQARAMHAAATFWSTGVYSGLAEADWKPLRDEAAAQARQARAEDPTLGLAYYVEAAAASKSMTGFPKRLHLLREGQARDPASAEISLSLCVGLNNAGYIRDATAECERAFRFDPFSVVNASNLAEAFAFGGRPAEAARLLDQADQIWPGQFYTALTRFEFLARKQDPVAALNQLSQRLSSDESVPATPVDRIVDPRGYRPEFPEEWRRYLEARGKSPAAIAAAARTMVSAANALVPRGQAVIVQNLVQLGQVDAAYTVLFGLESWPDQLNYIWFRDYMAPLRADPRFLRFAARQSLTGVWAEIGRQPDFCGEQELGYRCPGNPSGWRAIVR